MRNFSRAIAGGALLAMLALLPAGACAAGLSDIKTVYLLPMTSGLDQYLAVQLTTGSVLQVVIDPQKADVIFTDHLGESLEQTLADLYADKTKAGDAADTKAADNGDNAPRNFGRTGMQGQQGRGTVFLVDRKNHTVLWSNYEGPPKFPNSDGMKHTASQIASKLARAIKGK
jgi:hypothetical protein